MADRLDVAPPIRALFTSSADGDLGRGADPEVLGQRRRRLAPVPWTRLDQVHGADVVVVDRPGGASDTPADAAVTNVSGAALCVVTADCAPVLFWSLDHLDDPGAPVVVGAAHAGWRGLVAGVLEACVATMAGLGAQRIDWRLGPCISPDAYEFAPEDLDLVADRLGPSVRSRTASGAPALDTRAGVAASLRRAGLEVGPGATDVPCTATDDGWYSWRARRDASRQAGVVWIEPGPGT